MSDQPTPQHAVDGQDPREVPAVVAAEPGGAFPQEEYAARVNAVRTAMEAKGMDAVLVTSPPDIYYLTGLDHDGYFAFTAAVVSHKRVVLVIRGMEKATLDAQVPHLPRVFYGDDVTPVVATLDAVEQAGVMSGHVGVDYSTPHIPLNIWRGIQPGARDRGVVFTDASDLVSAVRMIKSPAEIGYVRRAAAVTDRALQAGLHAAREGVTERDIARSIGEELIAGGGQPGFAPFVRSGLARLGQEHVTWTDRRLEWGDPVVFELSGSVRRYHAPGTRTLYVGELPAGVEVVAAGALAGLDAVQAALWPGALAGEVYDAWETAVEAEVGRRYERHHCGYAVGIGFPPSWAGLGTPNSLRRGRRDLVLESGMEFHILSWFLEGSAPYCVSDTMLVTPQGGELLTTMSRELIVV